MRLSYSSLSIPTVMILMGCGGIDVDACLSDVSQDDRVRFLEQEYDRFTDNLIVSSGGWRQLVVGTLSASMGQPSEPAVFFYMTCPGNMVCRPEEVRAVFASWGAEAPSERLREVFWLFDGDERERMPVLAHDWDRDTGITSSYVTEFIEFSVSRHHLEKIACSEQVEYRFGWNTGELDEDAILRAKNLLSVIEGRVPLEDIPTDR